MIEKIDHNQINNILENSSQQSGTGNIQNNQLNASLEVNYASLIEKAMQDQTDSAQVQQAEELLKSGQLETDQNIQAAAENIINFGI